MGRAGPKVANCSQKHAQNKNSLQNGPRVLFIGGQVTGLRSNVGSAFERTSYLRSNVGYTVERK